MSDDPFLRRFHLAQTSKVVTEDEVPVEVRTFTLSIDEIIGEVHIPQDLLAESRPEAVSALILERIMIDLKEGVEHAMAA
jgi:hypothetical protein